MLAEHPDVTRQLRALWALHVTGGIEETALRTLLDHPHEAMRGWAIQLLCEDRNPTSGAGERFKRLAIEDPSALVRLYLASALQRLDAAPRWDIAEGLLAHGEDAKDQNLPLMVWYALEPLVALDPSRAAAVASAGKVPLLRRHVARRASEPDVRARGVAAVVQCLPRMKEPAAQFDFVAGMLEGLKGTRSLAMPAGWSEIAARLRADSNRGLAEKALELSLVFDDPEALRELRSRAQDPQQAPALRVKAIEALAGRHPSDLAPLLLALTQDPATRRSAVRALAEYDHAETPTLLVAAFSSYDAAAQGDVVQTLASRPAWAQRLLDAVESGSVPRANLTAFVARQMDQLGDAALSGRVKKLWGEIRSTDAEKKQQIDRWGRTLSAAVIAMGDRSAGRKHFERLCSACHRLFDEGGTLGPDLTGAQRNNPTYLLENIIDPSAGVPREYQVNTIRTTGGRIVSGFVVAEDSAAVTVASLNERITIPVAEIQERQQLAQSMMPEGLLQGLKASEVRDLIAYLGSAEPPRK
jgi:putative heme-binding domain-containing protein